MQIPKMTTIVPAVGVVADVVHVPVVLRSARSLKKIPGTRMTRQPALMASKLTSKPTKKKKKNDLIVPDASAQFTGAKVAKKPGHHEANVAAALTAKDRNRPLAANSRSHRNSATSPAGKKRLPA